MGECALRCTRIELYASTVLIDDDDELGRSEVENNARIGGMESLM